MKGGDLIGFELNEGGTDLLAFGSAFLQCRVPWGQGTTQRASKADFVGVDRILGEWISSNNQSDPKRGFICQARIFFSICSVATLVRSYRPRNVIFLEKIALLSAPPFTMHRVHGKPPKKTPWYRQHAMKEQLAGINTPWHRAHSYPSPNPSASRETSPCHHWPICPSLPWRRDRPIWPHAPSLCRPRRYPGGWRGILLPLCGSGRCPSLFSRCSCGRSRRCRVWLSRCARLCVRRRGLRGGRCRRRV